MSYHFKIIYLILIFSFACSIYILKKIEAQNILIINKLFSNKDKEKENPPKNQLKIQNNILN